MKPTLNTPWEDVTQDYRDCIMTHLMHVRARLIAHATDTEKCGGVLVASEVPYGESVLRQAAVDQGIANALHAALRYLAAAPQKAPEKETP